MQRTLLLVVILGLLITGCSGKIISAPTATGVPLSPTLASPKLLAEIDIETQTGTSYSLDWSPDGQTLAVSTGVEIILVDGNSGEIISILKPARGALTATWSPDRKSFATVTGFRNPKISLWDWDSAALQLTLANEIETGSDQYGVAWSPDGRLLASLANDRKSTIQVWDSVSRELLHQYSLPYVNPRRALNWSADSRMIYDAGELDGQAVYFALNVENGEVKELGKLPIEQVYTFTISPDSKRIVVADEGGKVRIFDVETGALMIEFQSVETPVDLAWNPKHMTLAILGYKTVLQIWNVSP